MSTQNENLPFYSDATIYSMSLGCLPCPFRSECGGLFVDASLFHCSELCCLKPDDCQFACPNNALFEGALSEVGDLSLSTLPRVAGIPVPALPPVVPLIYHGSRRTVPLRSEAVAIKLSHLIDPRTNRARFESKEAVARHFGFDPAAQLLIMGVDKDSVIEPIWSLGSELGAQLFAVSPSLVTTPNYSTGFDVPRPEDLVNIKRIAKTWVELTSWNLPVSLHLNARTDHDWARWTDFIKEREEINSVTFEFRTAARAARSQFHVEKLLGLADSVGRPLQIVVRGGRKYLPMLARHFGQVFFVDTSSFVVSMKRQILDWTPGRISHWRQHPTPHGEDLSGLLQANIDLYAKMVIHGMLGRITSRPHQSRSNQERCFGAHD